MKKLNVQDVVEQACVQLGVDTVGKSLRQQAHECWEMIAPIDENGGGGGTQASTDAQQAVRGERRQQERRKRQKQRKRRHG